MHTYNVELTDTFCGEANYSWVRRFSVKARTMRGAVIKANREIGGDYRKVDENSDYRRYDSCSGCTCYFIEQVEDACERL